MRLLFTTVIASFALVAASAGEDKYIMNFNLDTNTPDGNNGYSIQLQGIHLLSGKPFHGDDLGKYDYFLTVSTVESGKGKLTVEFYEYETRRKVSDAVSEIVAEVDFDYGVPAVFKAASETFGVDLAFSISQE